MKFLQRLKIKFATKGRIKNTPPVKKYAVVVGATSSLAYALCHQLAQQSINLVLVARNKKELERLKKDIVIRNDVEVTCVVLDLLNAQQNIENFVEQLFKPKRPVDMFFMVAGDVGDMGYQERPSNIEAVTRINYTTPAKILTAAAEAMVNQERKGVIVVVSSVAGDRGRQSNYVYGSAKAALNSLASGLRNKFFGRGIHVVTIKPGFIDTPMTYGMHNSLIASREMVAKSIIRAAVRKKNIAYVPTRWHFIMAIICHIPEWLFKRLSL
jgi:decaprenylphospho-beta-D-erythro-pentofuranosid-2-ulose 2-reductase